VMDWKHRKDTVYTPQAEFGDLTGLNQLPPAKVTVSQEIHERGKSSEIVVTAENQGSSIALMVHARVTRGRDGEDLTPIFWSDNYFSLLPGEQRTVTARYDSSTLGGKLPVLIVDGFNVAAVTQ
jgi:exo-1,4-beta-D-glucosaminidase